MLIDFKTLVYDMLYKNFRVAHLDTKVKFDVTDTDGVGNKFREAVKKEYTAKFLDDSEYVIGFKEPIADENKEEKEPEDEEKPENTEDDSSEEDDAEDIDDGEEGSEENEEDVNESEVKTLTSKMLKTEAETKATGDDLKAKIRKSIAYTFGIEDHGKVDMYDLPDFLDGFNVFFTKLSLKTKKD